MNSPNEMTDEIVQQISDYVNSYSTHSLKYFGERMGREHRTLQQDFSNLCIAWIRHLAKQEMFDLRNEDSVKLAQKLAPVIEEFTNGAEHLRSV
jgi:hypothetical protein